VSGQKIPASVRCFLVSLYVRLIAENSGQGVSRISENMQRMRSAKAKMMVFKAAPFRRVIEESRPMSVQAYGGSA